MALVSCRLRGASTTVEILLHAAPPWGPECRNAVNDLRVYDMTFNDVSLISTATSCFLCFFAFDGFEDLDYMFVLVSQGMKAKK